MVNVLWNTITLPSRYDPDSIPITPPKCTDTVKLECGKVHFHVPNRTYGLCGSLKYKQIFDHRVSKSGDGIGLRMFPLCCRISMVILHLCFISTLTWLLETTPISLVKNDAVLLERFSISISNKYETHWVIGVMWLNLCFGS